MNTNSPMTVDRKATDRLFRENLYFDRYGIKPMGFEEEMALWRDHEPQAQTRNNKRIMVDKLANMADHARMLMDYIKRIPEDDDAEHSFRVQCLSNDIQSLAKALSDVYWDNANATIKELEKKYKNF